MALVAPPHFFTEISADDSNANMCLIRQKSTIIWLYLPVSWSSHWSSLLQGSVTKLMSAKYFFGLVQPKKNQLISKYAGRFSQMGHFNILDKNTVQHFDIFFHSTDMKPNIFIPVTPYRLT